MDLTVRPQQLIFEHWRNQLEPHRQLFEYLENIGECSTARK